MQQGDPLVKRLNAEIKRKDALISDLVAALKPFTCCGDRKYLLDEEFASADAAIAKAKAAGYEP